MAEWRDLNNMELNLYPYLNGTREKLRIWTVKQLNDFIDKWYWAG